MNMQGDSEAGRAADEIPDAQEEIKPDGTADASTAEATPATSGALYPRRRRLPNLIGLTTRLQRIRLIPQMSGESDTLKGPDAPTEPVTPLGKQRWKWRRRAKKDRLADWQNWSKFRLWRNTRPLWGSILMIIAGAIMLIGAIILLPMAFLVSSIWPAILVSGLLLVMGVIQLFLPTYAVITGSIGIVLSLVSLLVASFGGCGLGLLLGIIGSALSIAWRPVKSSRLLRQAGTSSTH
ncbi:MAG TPA: DUF6114 domain-containing protein [Ktedonobacteraceae bacterium]|nr:DUF6114 domain-containing protein [Ktedonobacteraceae bacterium]HLI70012.1 DUF6114 domain-containing protein [Ktedonobacteraceae bacterium]